MKPTVSDALTAFAEALQRLGIEPEEVEVLLPLERWQGLGQRLDEETPNRRRTISECSMWRRVRYLIRHR